MISMIALDYFVGIETPKLNVPDKLRVSAFFKVNRTEKPLAHVVGSRLDRRPVRESSVYMVRGFKEGNC